MYSFLLIFLSMVCAPLSVRFYAIEMASIINIICVSIETIGWFRQVVNPLDFCLASLKSLDCVLSSQWKVVTVNL